MSVSQTMLKHIQLSSPDWPLGPAFLCPGRKGGGGGRKRAKLWKHFLPICSRRACGSVMIESKAEKFSGNVDLILVNYQLMAWQINAEW